MRLGLGIQKKTLIRTIEKILGWINEMLEIKGYQISYVINDFNYQKNRNIKSFSSYSQSPKTAILIQGPIRNPALINKTLEYYRNNFQEVGIILSTWENDPNLQLINLQNVSRLITSKPPLNPGKQNLNYQIKSTVAGLRCAQIEEFQFVVKTRTDQAMLSNSALARLQHRWASATHTTMARILTTDFNSFLFRPFHLSDQLQFFTVDTGLIFWEEQERVDSISDHKFDVDFPERYLLRRYLRRLGMNDDMDIRVSLEAIRDLFVIIDYEDLELCWFKGTARDLRSRFPQKTFPWEWSFCRYSDWLELQKDIHSYVEFFEQLKLTSS